MVEHENGTDLQVDITPEDIRTAMQASLHGCPYIFGRYINL